MSGFHHCRHLSLSVSQHSAHRPSHRSALSNRHLASPMHLPSSSHDASTEGSGEFAGGGDEDIVPSVSLFHTTNKAGETLVKPFKWRASTGYCGVCPSTNQHFCLRYQCTTHEGHSPNPSLIDGRYYVPTCSGTKAYLQPCLKPTDLDEGSAGNFLTTHQTVMKVKRLRPH